MGVDIPIPSSISTETERTIRQMWGEEIKRILNSTSSGASMIFMEGRVEIDRALLDNVINKILPESDQLGESLYS